MYDNHERIDGVALALSLIAFAISLLLIVYKFNVPR